MGNSLQYQVHVQLNDNTRMITPAPDEAWDDRQDAQLTFDHYVSECKQKRCKKVILVETEKQRVINRFPLTLTKA